eukprot:TRINITY_DN6868_c0_g1_i2.p1 TRINITY_DN6868_c0_g1~~TRINITY_DN6868_c0_g1_i2.p1  ORF type:complete len:183 (+),score=33.67 TRINITY_DN6868_c0_g1_i2:426-974(+)
MGFLPPPRARATQGTVPTSQVAYAQPNFQRAEVATSASSSYSPSYSRASASVPTPSDSNIDDDLGSMLSGFKSKVSPANVTVSSNSSATRKLPLGTSVYATGAIQGNQPTIVPISSEVDGCGRCGARVGFGKFMKALGKNWHNACFRCLFCNDDLVQWGKFFPSPNKDQPVCERCYRKTVGQ